MVLLFAIIAGFFPRIGFLILWLVRPALVDAAFNTFIFPLLGLIFLPMTTLMWVLVVGPLGTANIWGWLLVLIGLMLDLRSYSDLAENKDKIMPTTPPKTSAPTT